MNSVASNATRSSSRGTTPWERPHPHHRSSSGRQLFKSSQQSNSTTPLLPPPHTPASVGQAMAPRTPSSAKSPRSPHGQRSPSPNYFGLIVNPTNDPVDTNATSHAKLNWSPPTSSIRSPTTANPKVTPKNGADLDAFRSRPEFRNVSSGHTTLSPMSVDRVSAVRSSIDGSAGAQSPHGSLSSSPSTSRVNAPDGDRMDVDSADPLEHPSITGSVAHGGGSYFDVPRNDSPALITPSIDNARTQRNELSNLDDRHPRLSLPMNRIDPPSPTGHSHNPARSATLPLSMDIDSASMISPQPFVDLLRSSAHFLLLDLRVFPQYSQSRVKGALNLCIPTTLLKRPSFNLPKLADTFTNPEERARFEDWRSCQFLIVYDEKSHTLKDAVSCVNTLKKFTGEGWRGTAFVVSGGFASIAKTYPEMIDKSPSKKSASSSSKKNLCIEPPASGLAPLAGGCPMPTAKTAANPFFGNIRQNMDLIGGVGQIPIQRPSGMSQKFEAELPSWLSMAAREADQGKSVSERFLQIEKTEQRRMQDALSGDVSYGSPGSKPARSVQIAGIEKGSKNRYNNIWPYDHARVRLQGCGDGACDYVNASHVKVSWSRKRYIATQGPIPATFDDFWQVIWEQDVRVIVMLTAEKEGGQLKCHPYWTDKAYGPIRLKALSERKVSLGSQSRAIRPGQGMRRSTLSGARSPAPAASPSPSAPEPPHVIIRKFTLSHTSHPFTPLREITQLQYSSWPDFGAPAHPTHVLGLVEQCDAAVRSVTSPRVSSLDGQVESPRSRPVLVHCSAGCGRTGTFCTVDSVIDMMKRQRHANIESGVTMPMQLDSEAGVPINDSTGGGGDENDHRRNKNDSNRSGVDGSNSEGDESDDDSSWLYRDDEDLIVRAVEEFRHQRLSMVQSLRQFVLCYETVLEWMVAQQPLSSIAARDSARRSFPGGF
ncbi:MAG: hypothetical protein M1825_002149 [Sarcosagium campestre]|nr:MAG: hypothetical protein M1825_002149 [Sarcosagium campestre]